MIRLRWAYLFALALALCAFALVTSRHLSRNYFIELEFAQTQTKQLEREWAQLQLKQSTLSKTARVEAKATTELNMVRVTSAQTQYIVKTKP